MASPPACEVKYGETWKCFPVLSTYRNQRQITNFKLIAHILDLGTFC